MVQGELLFLLAVYVALMGLVIAFPWGAISVAGRALTISETRTARRHLLQARHPTGFRELVNGDVPEVEAPPHQKRPRI